MTLLFASKWATYAEADKIIKTSDCVKINVCKFYLTVSKI